MAEMVLNLNDIPLRREAKGSRFEARTGTVGERLGLSLLGATLYEVPPGKTACPYHRHHTSDEMFLVLSGTGTYRYADQHLPIRPGDCLAAPAGAGAHQIINTGTEPLRYLALSNNTSADVLEYPDSGRVRIDAGTKGFHRDHATFKAGGLLQPLGYWDGERIDDA